MRKKFRQLRGGRGKNVTRLERVAALRGLSHFHFIKLAKVVYMVASCTLLSLGLAQGNLEPVLSFRLTVFIRQTQSCCSLQYLARLDITTTHNICRETHIQFLNTRSMLIVDSSHLLLHSHFAIGGDLNASVLS